MWNKIKPYVIAIGAALIVGGLASLISSSAMEQFSALKQPPLSPPASVFPIVWTILYILMGIGAGMVYKADAISSSKALKLYIVQLLFNFGWTLIFFNLKFRLFAFIWLIALFGLVVAMFIHFFRIKPIAGILQIPYLLWLIFAGYLNLGVYLLNG